MTNQGTTRVMLVMIAVLAVVAIMGWLHHPAEAARLQDPQAVMSAAYNPDNPYSAQNPCVGSAPAVTPAYYQPAQPVRAPRAVTRSYAGPVYSAPVVRRQGRPFSHSAAIVGGSAGVGAAIGGIAGGGKGAAIGALSGGAAGFIYDRLTHNKTTGY